MTRHLLTGLLLILAPVAATAQDPHILVLDDTPGQTVFEISTRVRHTTVITLPAHENILDFVVGDAEYWHLSGSANVAFLKPTEASIETNIALVCESGRIYTFLVSERADAEPHLVVHFAGASLDGAAAGTIGPGLVGAAHQPAFVPRSSVAGYEALAAQAQARAAEAHREAQEQITAFRSDYPTRLRWPYRLEPDAVRWPFLVEGMWHDGEFTYLRSLAPETPALYEMKDGDPSLVPYDLTEDGLYVVRRIIGPGWLQIGDERVRWRWTPPNPFGG